MPLPTDPVLSDQWHLIQTVAGRFDLNVLGVWNAAEGPTYSGAGTRTVVIDDGFDYNHQDFDNYDQSLDHDFEFGTDDAFGTASNAHGTAVAGIIGAAADGTGAVGVAFDTSLVGYRTLGQATDAWLGNIRDAISGAVTAAGADVANISQSISNDAASEFGVGYAAVRFDEIETSIGTAVDTGRGGLGMTIVKGAGNSRSDNYDVNADDWTNDTRQVVVAAVGQTGFVESYSSYGAALLVSGLAGVLTTDRAGAAGYFNTDFVNGFGGTSAATPTVAGVVALMYEANAGLGWRDVQSILGVSARHVGSEVGSGITGAERFAWEFNGADTWNGGGQHFSNDYGYGLVDALAAVRLAETWLLNGTAAARTSNQSGNAIDVLNTSTLIADNTSQNFSGTAGSNDIVERVTVQLTFSTTRTEDLELQVTSPWGTTSRLIAGTGGGNDFNSAWTFESQAFHGERGGGQWTVRVGDAFAGDVLTVSDIVIRTFGIDSVNDRYVMTNELSVYAGMLGHVTTVVDSNGGTDTVNAAAVTSASTIRLDGVSGLIDGVGMTFSGIENAIGGDGADQIHGNIGSNRLFGMRGADALFGGDSTDSLYGGTGNDTLNGGVGHDNMSGGAGNDLYLVDSLSDTIIEGATGGTLDRVAASVGFVLAADDYIERLQTTSASGTGAINLTGNGFAQSLFGNAGANVLSDGGGAGVDTLTGAAGNDTYVVRNAAAQITDSTGTDRVAAGVSFTLGSGDAIEVLTTTSSSGTTAINLTGNALIQSLFGNAGANRLNGGAGSDTLTGGAGADRFVFTAPTGSTNVDTITDFSVAADTIEVLRSGFAGLAAGVLAVGAFRLNATGVAGDASDRVIYNSATGDLWFDADGTGGASRIRFADLDTGLALTNADIFAV